MRYLTTTLVLLLHFMTVSGQSTLNGNIRDEYGPVPFAIVVLNDSLYYTSTDTSGNYVINDLNTKSYTISVKLQGKVVHRGRAHLKPGTNTYNIRLENNSEDLQEVVVTGTMKEVSKMNSPIPVDIITPKFFKKNPTPNLFEAVGMLNGVKPQLNCNVCNTGDIHINGMEGPYTMILIDGMPIVSSLSTVYGLSGIPNSIVERIEVVKGPASSLYGSEAMGGIINVITRTPLTAPVFSFDLFGTSWKEYNADISMKITKGKAYNLLGVNYFNYQSPIDNNGDGFTDVTLQNRISVFNKLTYSRLNNRIASIAARYVYEDRWGGQMNWNKRWRDSDSIYGESIYTQRIELIGNYQLPFKERVIAQLSYNWHNQDSYYGIVPFMATQQVAFGQVYWDKAISDHSILAGMALRYNYYDDNSPATATSDNSRNQPSETIIPGIFLQDEWTLRPKHTLLIGYRYDYDKNHGNIHSPRAAYKWSPNAENTIRASFGTGFRVVNLFTEDHAALTGARQVVIAEELHPERSCNGNLNYVFKSLIANMPLNVDITAFYSYFTNKIVGDFDSNPNEIIYKNLKGHAISRGISLNADISFLFPLKVLAGVSYMDVYQVQRLDNGTTEKIRQLHAPEWSGNFVLSYNFSHGFSADLTGNWYGPMRLPVLPNDYRPEYSPWFCITNIQITKKWRNNMEIYGGIKNLFNFVPDDPIMRPQDPFDKHVNDPVNNPYGYTFDPSYNYASMQGIRGFLGVRWSLK